MLGMTREKGTLGASARVQGGEANKASVIAIVHNTQITLLLPTNWVKAATNWPALADCWVAKVYSTHL